MASGVSEGRKFQIMGEIESIKGSARAAMGYYMPQIKRYRDDPHHKESIQVKLISALADCLQRIEAKEEEMGTPSDLGGRLRAAAYGTRFCNNEEIIGELARKIGI
ncbi:TPA: hypothetical protein HA297_00465 [Candidatus Woesearchaeota archaeon]|nr:hypothetical protein [Candidatus Woesearchaeota archaeon]